LIQFGKIEPVRRRFLPNGKIDPLTTEIAVADVAEIARRRGERPRYLAHLVDGSLDLPVDGPITSTGCAGRPSMSIELFRAELTRRAEYGEMNVMSLAAEVRELLDWFARKHREKPCPAAKTLKNSLRRFYNKLKLDAVGKSPKL
jgi:hypothetical protein